MGSRPDGQPQRGRFRGDRAPSRTGRCRCRSRGPGGDRHATGTRRRPRTAYSRSRSRFGRPGRPCLRREHQRGHGGDRTGPAAEAGLAGRSGRLDSSGMRRTHNLRRLGDHARVGRMCPSHRDRSESEAAAAWASGVRTGCRTRTDRTASCMRRMSMRQTHMSRTRMSRTHKGPPTATVADRDADKTSAVAAAAGKPAAAVSRIPVPDSQSSNHLRCSDREAVWNEDPVRRSTIAAVAQGSLADTDSNRTDPEGTAVRIGRAAASTDLAGHIAAQAGRIRRTGRVALLAEAAEAGVPGPTGVLGHRPSPARAPPVRRTNRRRSSLELLNRGVRRDVVVGQGQVTGRLPGGPLGVERVLQDHDRGGLIDHSTATRTANTRLA